MKAFSPAGMAVKGFLGPGPKEFSPGARPWGNFGNPDGNLSGNGAWAAGGGGGGGAISGVFTLTSNNGFPDPNGHNGTGFWDATFNFGQGAPGTGNVVPGTVGGKQIGWFGISSRPPGIVDLWFGLYSASALTQGAFNQVSFTDQFGTPQVLTSASAVQFLNPEPDQWYWNWEPLGAPVYFNAPAMYVITVS